MADGTDIIKSPENTVSITSGSAALMQVIAKAASDPAVDIDKMERLAKMRSEMLAEEARIEFDKAFAEMWPELPYIPKSSTGHNGNYAKWEDIQGKIMPVLARWGFGLRFKIHTEGSTIGATAVLSLNGHSEDARVDLPIDKSGSKNDQQGVGSSVTYAKRYAAAAALNLRIGGLDNDADTPLPKGPPLVTQVQADELAAFISQNGIDLEGFLAYGGISRLEDMHASEFSNALALLHKKAGK